VGYVFNIIIMKMFMKFNKIFRVDVNIPIFNSFVILYYVYDVIILTEGCLNATC